MQCLFPYVRCLLPYIRKTYQENISGRHIRKIYQEDILGKYIRKIYQEEGASIHHTFFLESIIR